MVLSRLSKLPKIRDLLLQELIEPAKPTREHVTAHYEYVAAKFKHGRHSTRKDARHRGGEPERVY